MTDLYLQAKLSLHMPWRAYKGIQVTDPPIIDLIIQWSLVVSFMLWLLYKYALEIGMKCKWAGSVLSLKWNHVCIILTFVLCTPENMCFVNYSWSGYKPEQLNYCSDWGIDLVIKELGFDSWQGYFSCLHSIQTCSPPSFPSVETAGPYPGIKWLWDEIDHSLPSCCKAKNVCSQS